MTVTWNCGYPQKTDTMIYVDHFKAIDLYIFTGSQVLPQYSNTLIAIWKIKKK